MGRVLAVAASALAVLAIGILYQGSASIEPIIFAELYLWLFTAFVLGFPLIKATARDTGARFWLCMLVFAGCLAGAASDA